MAPPGEAEEPDSVVEGARADLMPGTTVGQYEICEALGEGAFGTVYRAEHPVIGKQVAIKVLSRRYTDDATVVSRFVDEARAVNQIKNANIVDIFGFGNLDDGRFYYVMELLEGEPLDRQIRGGGLAPEQVLPILAGVAQALDAAHAKGIVHRDLKPENVCLVYDSDGQLRPKLLDFGIAKLIGDEPIRRTRTGAPIGTPYYMSPEQCRGLADIDHRTDIYAFGVLAFELLTGTTPFMGQSYLDLMKAHVSDPRPKVSERHSGLSEELDAPIAVMMAKAAEDRPFSILEAFVELAKAAKRGGYRVDPSLLELPTVSVRVSVQSRRSTELTEAETLEAPKLSTTLGAETLGTAAAPTARSPYRRKIQLAAVIFLASVAVLATVVAYGRRDRTIGSAGSMAGVATNGKQSGQQSTSNGAPSLRPVPPPVSSMVHVTINAVPEKVKVIVGRKEVGTSPGPIALPRGSAPVVLQFRATGYKSGSAEFVPRANGVVAIELGRKIKRAKVPSGQPTTTDRDPKDDLEF